jgi:hypothetical protein
VVHNSPFKDRLLLRLDALELNVRKSDHDFEPHEPAAEGLPYGTLFPNFELPELSGNTAVLRSLRGRACFWSIGASSADFAKQSPMVWPVSKLIWKGKMPAHAAC